MLNRRHIRAKVMQTLYAIKRSGQSDLANHKAFLDQSMQSMYDLYLLMLSLLIQVHQKAFVHQSKLQNKHLPTSEDINPNKKFVNNQLLVLLSGNTNIKDQLDQRKINHWELDDEYVELIFRAILSSSIYDSYMSSTVSSYQNDSAFIVELYKDIIATNDKLYDYLEDKNLSWVDDLPVVNTMIVKLISKSKASKPSSYFTPLLFKDIEDKTFGFDLLEHTLTNIDTFAQTIEQKTKNWDKDRIADIDFVLLQMAICEFSWFPSIPTKVTINEYIELAKEYSTPKSNVFINGVLDKILKELEESGQLNKKGRGLM